MDVGLLGISYRSSELGLRERFARACEKLVEKNFSQPIALLSTCNRTEIYFSSNDLIQTYSDLICALDQVLEWDCRPRLYCYFGQKCFAHLAKVTSGVDSAIFGETEIQRQVKLAYENAAYSQKLPFAMHYLFQKSLKIGKEIRTECPLTEERASIEWALWDLAQCFFSQKKTLPILFIGYSEINRKIIRFFQKKGIGDLYLATRSLSAVEEMTKKMGVQSFSWDKLATWTDFPMVVCGSKSSEFVLKADRILENFSQVRSRLIIDLSLPRNVDPSIAKSPLITLFNIEEIEKFIDQKYRTSFQKQREVEKKIEDLTSQQVLLFQKKRILTCA